MNIEQQHNLAVIREKAKDKTYLVNGVTERQYALTIFAKYRRRLGIFSKFSEIITLHV